MGAMFDEAREKLKIYPMGDDYFEFLKFMVVKAEEHIKRKFELERGVKK